jgi:hypothetical protein
VTPAELIAFLREFYRDTLDLFRTRLDNARAVTAYDANNGYQQVLGRQEVHLRWLADALADLAGAPPDSDEPDAPPTSPRDSAGAIIEVDVRRQKDFIDRWSPKVVSVTNARNRKMLELIVGEMQEHLRVLEQAKEGRTDLLGRHSDGKVLRGEVLAARPKN